MIKLKLSKSNSENLVELRLLFAIIIELSGSSAVMQLSEDENLDYKKLVDVISNYLFTEKAPLRDDVIGLLNTRPSLKERASISERITTKITDFIDTFINGM